MFDYTGKVVAVTGASSGLGKQMSEGYAQQGANLVLLARRVERLQDSAKEWSEKYGVDVLPVACELAQSARLTFFFVKRFFVSVYCASTSRTSISVSST